MDKLEKDGLLSSNIVDFYTTWATEQSNRMTSKKSKAFPTGFIRSLLENPPVVTKQTSSFINEMNRVGGFFFYYFFYENQPGEWALFEYDAVKDRFSYYFNNRKSANQEETIHKFLRVSSALRHLFNNINMTTKNYNFKEELDLPSCEDPAETGLFSLEFFRRRIFGLEIRKESVTIKDVQHLKKTILEVSKSTPMRLSMSFSRDNSRIG